MLPIKLLFTAVAADATYRLLEGEGLGQNVLINPIAGGVEDREGNPLHQFTLRVAYGTVHGPDRMQVTLLEGVVVVADVVLNRLNGEATGYVHEVLEDKVLVLIPTSPIAEE